MIKRLRQRFWTTKPTRSFGGDMAILLFIGAAAAFSALPLVYAISNAFKPLNELFLWPPQFLCGTTLANFYDLLVLMSSSWVPFSRYLVNTLVITLGGTAGPSFWLLWQPMLWPNTTFQAASGCSR